MEKAALRKAILDELESELRLLTDAANTARDEATNEESRAEDRFDMRSQSAAYLAAGQAKMAGESADAIVSFQNLPIRAFSSNDLIASGALVTLEAAGRKTYYFVGPQRGGLEVEVDGKIVIVVTTASPLGHQLIGRRVGDEVTLPGRSKPVTHRVVSVE
ncbi:MAG: GreA/GreB family elongation factor [Opitutaceae bacterium]